MKTQLTKKMEQALIYDALRKGKHPALEVEFWHTTPLNGGRYGRIGQVEYIDAVIENNYSFTCCELKVSMSDLHSKAAQTFVGHKNYLVCPMQMAKEIKQTQDPWLKDHQSVGIIGWDGKNHFKIIKFCKKKYFLPHDDWRMLARGMIVSLSKEVKKEHEND